MTTQVSITMGIARSGRQRSARRAAATARARTPGRSPGEGGRQREPRLEAGPGRAILNVQGTVASKSPRVSEISLPAEILAHGADRDGAVGDGRGHAPRRAVTDVAGREDPGQARLERVRRPVLQPLR